MSSSVFKIRLADPLSSHNTSDPAHLDAKEDDGDAMLLLCNIIHLRNDKLPSRIPTETLHHLAVLAEKYACTVAVGRATVGWFDKLYHAPSQEYVDVCRAIEAAILLDEPMFFTRFTERWLLQEPFGGKFNVPPNADARTKMLPPQLVQRRQALIYAFRGDLDLLLEPCSVVFSKSAEHYIDYAPGMVPEPEDDGRIGGSMCHVDQTAAMLFLGILRDERIWPATVWPPSLGEIVDAVKMFRMPDHDDCDKCEFCEDTQIKFRDAMKMVKSMHGTRMWGVCLDCFKAGGFNAGECRYEHAKPKG